MGLNYPESIHPKNGFVIKFGHSFWADEYLRKFKIISNDFTSNEHTFIPLNLKFKTFGELREFLLDKDIYTKVVDYESEFTKVENGTTIVNTKRIYEIEAEITKYLINYKYYTINEIADMLSFSRPTIYKIIKEGKLKSVKINGQTRIKHSELNEYINNENKK